MSIYSAIIPTAMEQASPLPHKARGSQDHSTPGGLLLQTTTTAAAAVEAACYATLPGYGGRGTGRISALAGLVWWSSQTDRQTDSDATRSIGVHGMARGKKGQQTNLNTRMYRYLSICWYTTSIVAFHVECRGLQLRSTRRACQQVQV